MSEVMQHIAEVTDANFEQMVVEGSMQRPVIVDLWAAWCGPCRTLGPILEKVAAERAGAFLLAKLDVDANPMVAGALGVQSIPTVIAFRDGQPVNGFVGSFPEEEVNRFVDAVLPTQAEVIAEEAQAVEDSGDLAGAEQRYKDALASDPDDREASLGLARILADRGEDEAARRLATPHLPDPQAERVLAKLRVHEWGALDGGGGLASAQLQAAEGSWRQALDGMLAAIASQDRDAARESMLTVFAVLGEDDPLVGEYRRKLTNALF